jgi:hypothetical protein
MMMYLPFLVAIVLLCSRTDAFLPNQKNVLSSKRFSLVARRASTESEEKPLIRPGPVIKDWTKIRVPTRVEPYGLNVEINESNDQTLNSTPRDGVVTCLVWPFDGDYIHPERRPDLPVGQWLNERPNLGIALSGGGMRAASTCLGW